jgi:type II secretory pathway pseudopilin PulG
MPRTLPRPILKANGFTLLDLLVVILIAGTLAAAASPAFLGQQSTAYDANAETMVRAAQVAEETYARANNGAYTTSTAALEGIDPSLADTSGAALGTPSGVSATSFTVSATAANTGDGFTIVESHGAQRETCSVGTGGAAGRDCTRGSW